MVAKYFCICHKHYWNTIFISPEYRLVRVYSWWTFHNRELLWGQEPVYKGHKVLGLWELNLQPPPRDLPPQVWILLRSFSLFFSWQDGHIPNYLTFRSCAFSLCTSVTLLAYEHVLSCHSWGKVKVLFEGRWLLNKGHFTIKMNILDNGLENIDLEKQVTVWQRCP